MRIAVFFMFLGILQVHATYVFSQKTKVSFNFAETKLVKVLDKIENESGYFFLYNEKLLNIDRKVSIAAKDQSISTVLDHIFAGTNVKYTIIENKIILAPEYLTKDVQQQKNKISGTITDSNNGETLIGVNVLVEGTKIGVVTDVTGKYSINAPKLNSVLIVSYMGYKSQKILYTGQQTLDIKLVAGVEVLNEVVVVGYGKQKRRDLTGSVSNVKAADVKDVAAAEFGQRLQGKVAGLQVSQVSGRPGQGMTFRIRGAASLSSGNQPLYVIDGQPITGDINLVNPDDIESFSVLKDAAATSLYGSRASNGVIMITTKQGQKGQTSLTANIYYGFQQVPQRGRPDLMNANEFATYMKGYYEDKIKYEGWKNPSTGLAEVPAEYADPSKYGKGTNWYDAVLRNAPIQNYSLTFTSGNDKSTSSSSLTYFDQDGVVLNTNTYHYAFRTNNEYRPNDKVKVGLNLAPTYQIDHNTRASIDGNRAIISGAGTSSPLIDIFDNTGNYNLKTGSYGMYALPNFVQQAELLSVNQNTFRMLGNTYVDVEIIKNLHAKAAISTDLGAADYNSYYGKLYGAFGSPPPRTTATAQSSSYNYNSWLSENTVTYANNIGEHSFDFLVGYSSQKYEQNNRVINGSGFANDAIPWIIAATTTSGNSNHIAWSVASEFARANYNFKKRYYLNLNIRRDGSSRFGENKKYGNFPSASVGWIISDESFFPKSDIVSFLKFKGSYGLTGNFNVGNYTQVSLLSATNYVFNNTTTMGQSMTSLGNKDLTWETSKQTDIGAEMRLLKNRVTVSYDYYLKKTDGMLSSLQIPYASGYSVISYNLGNFKMWGHEIQVSSDNLTGKLKWTTDFNISFNDNKVMKLINGTPIGGVSTYNDFNRTAEGHHIGELYGYIYEGVYKNQADLDSSPKEATSAIGTAKMKDVNGDGKIDIKDRTFIGNPNPKYIFGITNNFQYKNFDLNIIIAGQVGNKIMNINLQNEQNLDGIFNIDKNMQDRWRSEANPGTGQVPRTLSNTTELYRSTNTNWVFSGDYLTVKNIALGYTFNAKQLKYIKSIRLYTSVQQAFVFTKYPGQNPEVNDSRDNQTTAGLDNGSFPIPRTFMIGANINF
ncbi:MAG: TonB-dependent receptor [Bacteroidetes bacterium]|nr:TonB-dependent receptor [Bacteroidota bacterium]